MRTYKTFGFTCMEINIVHETCMQSRLTLEHLSYLQVHTRSLYEYTYPSTLHGSTKAMLVRFSKRTKQVVEKMLKIL